MTNPKLGVYKLHESVKIPEKATEGSACFDIRAHFAHAEFVSVYNPANTKIKVPLNKDFRFVISPNERVLIPTGIIFDIPEGYSVRFHSRSSLALKFGLRLANSEAVIDSDYKNESFVILHNTSQYGVSIREGDRICQAELVKVQPVQLSETKTKPVQTTDRVGGFGSTGEK